MVLAPLPPDVLALALKTVLELLKATTAYFEKHGVEQPRLNVEHLLAHTLGLKRMDLYLQFDRPLSDAELEPLRDLVRRRAAGEPLQHLLGTVEFLGRTFRCDRRALVPRPETEQLCEMLLRTPRTGRVLDVGTGSGIIALTLAGAWPEAEVMAVDRSPTALALARENAAQLGLEGRVQFLESDLLAAVTGRFRLVVANLPYIPSGELPTLSREVRHDPHAALDGGPVGTELIERLIAGVADCLQGELALEIGQGQGPELERLLAQHNFQDIRTLPDYQGAGRFVFATHG